MPSVCHGFYVHTMPRSAQSLCIFAQEWIVADFNWNDLRAFLAVARSGRLTSAAARVGMDHTTVARRIAALEEQVAVLTLWVVFTVITRLAAGSKEKASEESVQEGSRANVCVCLCIPAGL